MSGLIILSSSANGTEPEILSEVGIPEFENPSIGSPRSIRKRITLVDSINSGPRDYSNNGLNAPTPITQDNTTNGAFPSPCQEQSAVSLSPLNLRNSTSLRPSQWIARGGSLSSPQTLSRTPDRFIPSRRPLNSTRQSFQLNKTTDKLTPSERITRHGVLSPDPFSRNLHRSGRLNEELRTLCESHSVVTGIVVLGRNNAVLGLRRSSLAGAAREISSGAVWNVGGSSAVSDTVIGVSNGRGGMLGSRTNAPLYTSMFLSRSDPEAEMETHERRLALAFNVDQSSRVLSEASPLDSPASSGGSESNRESMQSNRMKHVWKDTAWTREGSTMSWFGAKWRLTP